jgi:hypothetical protein
MSVKEKITADTIKALKLKEAGKERLKTLRLLQAAIKQKEIDERIVLNDMDIYAVLSKMIKQRKDSIEHFIKGNRQDLVDKEQFEIDILQSYLPKALDDATLEKLMRNAIKQANATSMRDISKVIAILKKSIQGRADMAIVSKKIKELLLKT